MTATVRARRVVAACVLAAALAACGSGSSEEVPTNGLDELSASQIERRARNAAREASTVQLSGTVLAGGASYRLDLRLTSEGAVGVVATADTTFELLRVGEDLFLRADADFWDTEDLPEELRSDPSEKLDDKYVRVPPGDPAYEELSGFTDMHLMLDGLLSLDGARATGGEGEVDGTPTIRVEANGGAGGALDVALTGPPYPLRLQRGGGAGELAMADWNEEYALHAPMEDDIVDYGDEVIQEEGS